MKLEHTMVCAVGNCMQLTDEVKRCYWNPASGRIGDLELEKRAYLDLCWFHQEVLGGRHVTVKVDGWNPE